MSLLVSLFLVYVLINKTSHTSSAENLSFELKINDVNNPKILTLQNETLTLAEVDYLHPQEFKNVKSVKLSAKQLDSLKKTILDNRFFSLKEKYENKGLMDGIGYNLSITMNDKSHSVFCYGEYPERFNEVLDKVLSLWPEQIEIYGGA